MAESYIATASPSELPIASVCPESGGSGQEVAVVSPVTKYYFDSSWTGRLITRYSVWVRNYMYAGGGDTTGMTINLQAGIGPATYNQTWTGILAGVSTSYTATLTVNDVIASENDWVRIAITSYFQAYVKFGTGFVKYNASQKGNPPGCFRSGEYTAGCPGGSLLGGDWKQAITVYYDSVPVTATLGPGYGSVTQMDPSYENWSSSWSISDTWYQASIFRLAANGSQSSTYGINQYTKTSVIATVTSGQLDVEVSNDGTNFVTYDSLTADGYVEVKGFSYIRLSVSSGTVDSAAIVSQRRFSRLSIEPANPRELGHMARFNSRRGWGKGDY